MLKLQNITKVYSTGNFEIRALDGIDLEFRQSEFVSVLGPSGCGKTTLLNIVGGLDKYTDGDLTIKGKSTKNFSSHDWDAYRNHSVGFVFQSYNLIPHQSILSNVELALTLSGMSKQKRREKAKQALISVGLEEHMHKRPNQLSGGQMQRVAIARAIINDPEILLADEPTGALDSQTSVQVMEILKEISKNRLVIMVTHNPELAEKYSDRIIRLKDGKITEDSSPYASSEAPQAERTSKKVKKPSMSFFTALSLSLNNLMTKKGRTLLTSFAGSIGIIGIALILAISNGIQTYINTVQEETLSSYPLVISAENYDMSSLFNTFANSSSDELTHERDKIYTNSSMYEMMSSFFSMEVLKNNLTDFKTFLESEDNGIYDLISDIKYTYEAPIYIYSPDTTNGVLQINPSTVMDFMTEGMNPSMMAGMELMGGSSTIQIWEELLDRDIMDTQYDLIAGEWPSSFDEVVLIVDKNNELTDTVLYSLGLKNQDELPEMYQAMIKGEPMESDSPTFEYTDLLNMTFKLVLPTDYFKYNPETNGYDDMRENETYVSYLISSGVDIKISGIIRPNEDISSGAMTGAIGYTSDLTEYVISSVNNSEIVKKQKNDSDIDVLSGLPFIPEEFTEPSTEEKATLIAEHFALLSSAEKAQIMLDISKTPSEEYLAQAVAQQMQQFPTRASMEAVIAKSYSENAGVDAATISQYLATQSDEQIATMMMQFISQAVVAEYEKQVVAQFSAIPNDHAAAMLDKAVGESDATTLAAYYDKYMPSAYSELTYGEVISTLGVCDLNTPSSISIYTKTFADKDTIKDAIDDYNKRMEAEGKEENVIKYTDMVGMLMSSITTIINAISYVLIAFVSTSLVVSSIMIGIITYISVLERTKEIGILRAMGASKRDVCRVFNAETLIVGFCSGAVGILLTLLISIPANIIITSLTSINNMVALPTVGAVALVIISMFLTFIAGLLPSLIAANKDPVVALRTE